MPVSVRNLFHKFVTELQVPREPAAFAHHVLTGLHSFIPSDYNSWKEISSHRGRRVSAVFAPHNPTAASLLPVFQRHCDRHPICNHWRQSGQHGGALSWKDVTSQEDFERQELYNEFYRPLGVQHQLLVALEIRPSMLIYLGVNRRRSPFSEQERLLLTAFQPYVSQALHYHRELQRLRSMLGSFEVLVDRMNQGIICLSPQNRISWSSKRARTYLQTYWHSASQTSQLPDTLTNWLLTQLQREDRSIGAAGPLTVHGQQGHLVIRLLREKTQRYLLLEEISSQPNFSELTRFGLTEREAEVLGWIARGKSNEETAALLGLCSQTVKKHLERIYDALGVSNRTEAALKVQNGLPHAP